MEIGPGDAAEAERRRALDVAYRFLAKRDRTELETRLRLERAGVSEPAIGRCLATLTERGHVDDARYAHRFAEDRRAIDGWGSVRIEQRLLAAGIARGLAAQACARDRAAELESAVGVLRRRVSPAPRDERDRARALGLLLRRGYALELAHDAVVAHGAGHRG